MQVKSIAEYFIGPNLSPNFLKGLQQVAPAENEFNPFSANYDLSSALSLAHILRLPL